jgi:hypothetical protein
MDKTNEEDNFVEIGGKKIYFTATDLKPGDVDMSVHDEPYSVEKMVLRAYGYNDKEIEERIKLERKLDTLIAKVEDRLKTP